MVQALCREVVKAALPDTYRYLLWSAGEKRGLFGSETDGRKHRKKHSSKHVTGEVKAEYGSGNEGVGIGRIYGPWLMRMLDSRNRCHTCRAV